MRTFRTTTPPGALLAILLVVVGIGSGPGHAQILSSRRSIGDQRAVEYPATPIAHKEHKFIREVLEPELILAVDTVRSKIVRTNYPIARIAISDPSVVDVNEFDSMEVEVVGKSEGEATMTMWFLDDEQNTQVLRYLVRVTTGDGSFRSRVERMQNQINEMFPNSQIQLIALRDKLIVKGEVRDSEVADKVLTLLGAQNNSGGVGGGARSFGGGNSGGQGNVAGIGNQQAGVAGGGFQIVNMLRVPGVHQVMLKVRVAELTRYSSRDMGADLRGLFGAVSLGHLAEGIDDFTAILDGEDLRFFIRAVTANGYGKILAEPTLITISGKPARFLAGGEFPVPTTVGVEGVGAATTTFRGFGTQLEFTPTVRDKDLIRLQVSPSFSSLNSDASVNGIPGLNQRMVDTTVDLREGQWLAIAGLIQDEQGGNRTSLPYLSKIPVVGGLFGRRGTTRQETELIVLVSPQLVQPMEADETPLLLPGMEVTDPTDNDFFLRQMTEGYSGINYRSTTQPEVELQHRGLQAPGSTEFPGLGSLTGATGCQACGGTACAGGCASTAPVLLQPEYLLGPSGFSE